MLFIKFSRAEISSAFLLKRRSIDHLTEKFDPLMKSYLQNPIFHIQYRQKGGERMRIRMEKADCEEIVIRSREIGERAYALRDAVEEALRGEAELVLLLGGAEHFIAKNDVLFFESMEGKVYAHTADHMYLAPHKLFELEAIMPSTFVRVSKSVIVNITKISSLRREVVGNGELTFRGSEKKTYFSRAYYKLLHYKIEEMRFIK